MLDDMEFDMLFYEMHLPFKNYYTVWSEQLAVSSSENDRVSMNGFYVILTEVVICELDWMG